jgi:hypothetical protein
MLLFTDEAGPPTGGAPSRVRPRFWTTWWLEAGCWLVAIVLGGMQQWASIQIPSSIDLVAYLDIGDAWIHGRWTDAINGYWNPLYSWILGAVLAVVRPSARFEYPTVEGVDFLIFLLTLGAFAWFLHSVRSVCREAVSSRSEHGLAIPDWAWVVGGYTLFTWSSVRWISLSSNTPDMAAAGLAYVAWGLLLRLDQRERRGFYPLLGVVLALGYFSRTPMLIAGVAMLLLAGWKAETPARRRGVVVAALVLVALVSPYVAAMSHARGHLTIGDNGKLNHAWLANPRPGVVPNRYWQGGPRGTGVPLHPVRVLWKQPGAYEFGFPIDGTYPAWTDPSYWYEGLTYHFDATAEWKTLTINALFYYYVFGRWILLLLVVALVAAGDLRSTLGAIGRNARYWAPAAVGLVLYLVAADLHVQRMRLQPPTRYFAVFVVVCCLILAFSFRFRRVRHAVLVKRVGALALVVVSVGMVASLADQVWSGLTEPAEMPPWKVARAIEDDGVVPGMRIATIGHPDRHVYWARLARVQIIADVPDDHDFWAAPLDVRDMILERLAKAGAEVVVSASVPDHALTEGWTRTREAGYGLRRFDDAALTAGRGVRNHRPAPGT